MKPRKKTYREFKSLTCVHRHQPYNIVIFPDNARLTVIDLVFADLIHISYKLIQSLETSPAIVLSLGKEHGQISHSLGTVVHAPDIIAVLIIDKISDKGMYRHIG